MDTMYILSFNVNEQLLMVKQNSCEVNREHARICSSVFERDSTRQNGRITFCIWKQFEFQTVFLNKCSNM